MFTRVYVLLPKCDMKEVKSDMRNDGALNSGCGADDACPTLPEQFKQAVARALESNRARVVRMEYEGRVVWVKRAVHTKKKYGHRLQDALARVLRIDLLRLTCDVSGRETLVREAAIIRALAAKGARVPEVLGVGEDWLALSDLGESLRRQLDRAGDAAELRTIALAAAYAVKKLHAINAWHGNPLVRNLAGTVDLIGFIDFEEDPAKHMNRASCRTRDILLFLFSLAPFEARSPGLLREVALVVLEGQPDEVIDKLRFTRRLVAPLVWILTPVRPLLGRDVRHAMHLCMSLEVVRERAKPKVNWTVVSGVGTLILILLYVLVRADD